MFKVGDTVDVGVGAIVRRGVIVEVDPTDDEQPYAVTFLATHSIWPNVDDFAITLVSVPNKNELIKQLNSLGDMLYRIDGGHTESSMEYALGYLQRIIDTLKED